MPYLLLDDCFSALDAVTVNTILETLHTVNAQTILCIFTAFRGYRKSR